MCIIYIWLGGGRRSVVFIWIIIIPNWNFNNKEIDRPFTPVEEDQPWRRLSPVVRVDMMIEQIKLKLSRPTKLLLCVLPDFYGPWKKKNLYSHCISPIKINDQYLADQYQVAAICYAYDAASQVGQLIKFDDFLETSSGDGAITNARPVPVQELPTLHRNVGSSMSL